MRPRVRLRFGVVVVILGLSIEFQLVIKGALILLAAGVYLRSGRD